jgi:hypothetical protein
VSITSNRPSNIRRNVNKTMEMLWKLSYYPYCTIRSRSSMALRLMLGAQWRKLSNVGRSDGWPKMYYLELLRASEGTWSCWSRLHLQSFIIISLQSTAGHNLSNFSPSRPIFGCSHPAPTSRPAQFITPPGPRATKTTLTETKSPLQNQRLSVLRDFSCSR